jgi:hypothetical protein
MGLEFKSVPVMPTSEASKRREELNVSRMRAGESVMHKTGASGYAGG